MEEIPWFRVIAETFPVFAGNATKRGKISTDLLVGPDRFDQNRYATGLSNFIVYTGVAFCSVLQRFAGEVLL
jgi:hypothetical protein